MRPVWSVVAALVIVAGAWSLARAEVGLGLTGGAAVAGEQDVKLKEFDLDGRLLGDRQARGVGPSVGPLVGVTLSAWSGRGPGLGLRLDALYWTTSVDVDRRTGETASRLTVDESRAAVFVHVLGRAPLGEPGGAYLFGGLGAGPVWTRIRHGDGDLGPSVGALFGVAVPLSSRLRLRLEARYLVTPDVDASPRPGERVETSGNSRGNGGRLLFGPHLDTQFVPLLVGVDWVF